MNKNNRGFSLVELMIVVAMLGGVSMLATNIGKQSTKSSTKFQFDSDTIQIVNEITGILSSSSKCLSNLNNKNALSDTLSSINVNQYYIASHASAPAGGYGNGGVKIDSYSIGATQAEVDANTSWLSITFQNKNILGGQSTITKKIKLYVTVNASNIITACNAVASGSGSSQWVSAGPDIYYPTGNVGIQTSTPLVALDVAGGIRAGDQMQVALCNSTTEGTQRYNKTTHLMEYCGYNIGPPVTYTWIALGGSPPTGAVLAFNLSTCPTGWKISDGTLSTVDLRGRNIIGVNSTYAFQTTGGNATHTLLLNEMAPHNHGYNIIIGVNELDAQGGITDTNFQYHSTDSVNTTTVPTTQTAFNIMDPYVALLYCEKI
jgi:prepilin-type N-terminal cleavage/methylation domain-containing protein